jgi:hypothetical protein
VLKEVLCARRMRDRRLQPFRDRQDFLMRVLTPRSAIDGDLLAVVENVGDFRKIRIVRLNDRI